MTIRKPQRSWKTTERRLLSDNYLERGADWCAVQLGRSPDGVRRYAAKHGIKGKRGRRCKG